MSDARTDGRLNHALEKVHTMVTLEGRLAVVTGGSSGIGFAIAKAFIQEGARVIVTGRREKELGEAVASLGQAATGFRGDVGSLQDLDRLYEVVAGLGRIDVLVANAGVAEVETLEAMTEQHFDRLFSTNVKGTVFTVKKALPHLRDGASIILISSVAGSKGTPGLGVYGATKAALRNFVRSWTIELKDRRIRSNVVSPGPVDTPGTQRLSAEAFRKLVSSVPMGRVGLPEEVAQGVLYLASDASSFVSGTELFVDGGRAQV
jgi:NAD(P)-dependent dehydrogenase (short-subunit alcohol dehydrogenase family)